MRLKGRGILVFLAVMLLMAGISRAAASFTVAQVEVEEPESGKIIHTVIGSGVAESRKGGGGAVYTAADVLVAEVAVQEGQRVSKGDILARLDFDSLREKIGRVSDEIESMRIQNIELAAMRQKEKKDRSRAKMRAREDYGNIISDSSRRIKEAEENVRDAEQKMKEAKKQAKKQASDAYKEKLEELQAEVMAAEKEYDDAKEQEEGAVLDAKRAVEDAGETQTLLRAQEDYSRTVKKYAKLVEEAKKKLGAAKLVLKQLRKRGKRDFFQGESVKAAEEALKETEKALEDARRQADDEKRQAKRNLEDASLGNVSSYQEEANPVEMEEKERQLAMLEAAEKNGGKIMAQAEGTVVKVQLEAGQRTGETAVFLMSVSSGGMSFTAEISEEDAVYVAAGDTVTLRTADKEYEGLSVASVERAEEEDVVKVTVLVPEAAIGPGEHAEMELEKSSREYGTILPVSAIRTENGKNFVYVMALEETVLGGQYVAKRVEVTVAERNEMSAALEDSELVADSQVIISSDQMISVGERVRLREGADG